MVVAATLTSLLAVVASPGTPAAAAGVPPGPPLASSVTTSSGSWATVAMGHLDQPLNTFWQLFFLASGATRWNLVTPTGVADNGGLVVAVPDTGAIAVGFVPSQFLRYSPLALSSNGGATWSPALVPSALSARPDALATVGATPATPGTAGSPGAALALVSRGPRPVLAATAGDLHWAPLAGPRSLEAAAGRPCHVDGLDAVAFAPQAVPLVGAGCRRPGQVGVFALLGRRWHEIGPILHGTLARAPTRVLRLGASNGTTVALVAAAPGDGSSLVGLWGTHGSWSLSPPLPLGRSASVVSTALGADGSILALVARPGGTVTEEVAGPGRPWTTLPSPPVGTATIAAGGNGSIDAFAVDASELRVFTLDAGAPSFVLTQTVTVPIAYGSSS